VDLLVTILPVLGLAAVAALGLLPAVWVVVLSTLVALSRLRKAATLV
jgi:hypothetical protein